MMTLVVTSEASEEERIISLLILLSIRLIKSAFKTIVTVHLPS